MTRPGGRWLVAAAYLDGGAALLHLAIIAGGPSWYRFFGAGERMARMAEHGSPRPALMAMAIAVVLATWAAYALAGAGLVGRLPLMRTALVAITAVYLMRSLLLVPALALTGREVSPFLWWSSIVLLGYGVVHGIGTFQVWPTLPPPSR